MPKWRKRNTMRARQLRRAATPAERALWVHLSGSKLADYKFSRQMQVGPFYCDFLCRRERLAVELDGFSHDVQPGRDEWRDRILAEYGIRVLHFMNEDVFKHMEGVLVEIEQALKEGPPPAPPASGRGE
jgi:very-short-patch-repair endonuclease